MRGVDHARAGGNLIELIDEDRTFFCEIVDDIRVVYDLFANVNRSAEGIEGNLNNVDRAYNTGTEAARLKQEDTLIDVSVRNIAGGVNGGEINRSSHALQYTASRPEEGIF